jgi:hypothetical protein
VIRVAVPAVISFAAFVAACGSPVPSTGPATVAASTTPEPLSIPALQSLPHLVFQNVRRDSDYAHVSIAPLDAPDGPRLPTALVCERVAFAARRGLCLAAHHTGESTYSADVFGPDFQAGSSIPLPGAPTLATVSADGRYGAASVFLPTDDDEDPFPTQTLLIDMAGGTRIGDLEEFAVTRDGADFAAADRDFSGATFGADSDVFFASLRTGGNTYLVRGTVTGRRMEVVRQNASSPSLGPDQSRIVIAKVISTIGPTFRLTLVELGTGAETPLAETTSIDDQVVWLDDAHVIYGRGPDIWSVPADGSGTPEVYIHDALSPSVVR